eukprot:TRINITY_DN643_c0_g4_i1.p1 TRINITY_DN643_c0_g4~~TRINITY_DN643_c0_g4_i1.p1  ORF type:complete len:668 (-),score=128.11 TRINITY_DN643_c0_g4_i1:165-2168(-)
MGIFQSRLDGDAAADGERGTDARVAFADNAGAENDGESPLQAYRRAYSAPAKHSDIGTFVHGTTYANLASIMKNGLKASNTEIYVIPGAELKVDSIPGLGAPPEILIYIDERKVAEEGIDFVYDPAKGTWRTQGINGVIDARLFQKVVDQRPEEKGNVIFQSKTAENKPVPTTPKYVVHATYWENVAGILKEGIVPAKNPKAASRRDISEFLQENDDHVYAIEPSLVRSRSRMNVDHSRSRTCSYTTETGEEDHITYELDIVGLDRPADALITIDPSRIKNLSLSDERDDTFVITGPVPPEAIVGIEPNIPVELPDTLKAKIVDPKCFQDIPIIDLTQDEATVLEQLKYACEVVGFMQVTNHGVSRELQKQHFEFQKRFFNLPAEKKLAIHTDAESPVRGYFGKGSEDLDGVLGKKVDGSVVKKTVIDNKEGLDMNGVPWSKPGDSYICHIFGLPNRLPPEEDLPGMKDLVTKYQDEVFALARRLLTLMAKILDLPADTFEQHLTKPVATHRMLHYWPIRDFKREIGIGPHTDYGLLTILMQDNVGGLQVLNAKDMDWVHCIPIEGAYIVNLGDMLARWTAHRFKSTVHRVVNISPEERYSTPYFLEPNMDSLINLGGFCTGPGSKEPGADEEDLLADVILDRFYTATGMLKEEYKQAYAKRLEAGR